MGISTLAMRTEDVPAIDSTEIKHAEPRLTYWLITFGKDVKFLEEMKYMATHIWVESTKSFYLGTILPRVSQSLRLILGLAYTPTLVGVQRWKPEEILPGTYSVKLDADSFGIKFVGEDALVSVAPSQKHMAICISPDSWRSKLESALAAAVAIAIGEYSESEISDPGLAYTKEANQSAKQFTESLMVDMAFNDLNKAAEYFFSRLPMSSQEKNSEMSADNLG